MNTKFFEFIQPCLLTTQLVAHGTKVASIRDAIQFYEDPTTVEDKATRGRLSVLGNLFGLYKVDAPKSVYDVTPSVLNTYARAYYSYVLHEAFEPKEFVVEWSEEIKELFEQQQNDPYYLFVPILKLQPYGEHTLELATFLVNIMSLALNGQQLLFTGPTYGVVKKYYEDGQFEAIEDFVEHYVRYRKFLGMTAGFTHYMYQGIMQYGTQSQLDDSGAITSALRINGQLVKAKYMSGTGDWTLSIYRNSGTLLGVAYYSNATSHVQADNIVLEECRSLWYDFPDYMSKTYRFDIELFATINRRVNMEGSRRPSTTKHMRDIKVMEFPNVTVVGYNTGRTSCLTLFRGGAFVDAIQLCNGDCYSHGTSADDMCRNLPARTTDAVESHTLAQLLTENVLNNIKSECTPADVCEYIANLLTLYDVKGLREFKDRLKEK